MTKKRKRGICLLIIGIILFYILLSNVEIIDELFPEALAFMMVLSSIMCIVMGILFITSKTVEEHISEYRKTRKENKVLAKYFNKKNYITYIILVINIIAFILTLFINDDKFILNFAISKEGILSGKVYEFITYMFLHTDALHISFNMLILLIFGCKLESLIGYKKYIFLYFISGIVGGLFVCFFSSSAVIGASGSLYAIIGALLIITTINKDKMEMLLNKTIVPLIIYSIIESLIFRGVSLSCHIGGLIAGIFFIIITGKEKYKLK